jgi:hypothetical protein
MVNMFAMFFIAASLSAYNLACGLVYRAGNNSEASNSEASRSCGLECALWFIAAAICLK